MRLSAAAVILGLVLSSCGPRESEAQRHHEANTPAGKLGQVAHKAALEADKAGSVVAKALGKQIHDVHEGWREDARKK